MYTARKYVRKSISKAQLQEFTLHFGPTAKIKTSLAIICLYGLYDKPSCLRSDGTLFQNRGPAAQKALVSAANVS